MTVEMVDVDGPVAWREAGTGPETIVFLHGLALTRTSWDPQLTALADRFRCVAWDLPGYGASSPLPELTFDAIADAITRLLDDLGVDKAHLVGLSFGGMHALHTALRHPDRVDRLVLLDSSAAFGMDGTDPDEWRRLRLGPLDAGVSPAEMANDVIRAVAGPAITDETLDDLLASMSRISADGLRAAVNCLPSHDVREQLGDIEAPTLVVVGELDDETPLAYAEMLVAGIPDARLEIVAGAGHLTPSEAPDAISSLIRSHLSDSTREPEA